VDSHEGNTGFDHLSAHLQKPVIQQSAKLLEQADHPRNVGRMSSHGAHPSVLGWCGDTMEIYLGIEQDWIHRASFAGSC